MNTLVPLFLFFWGVGLILFGYSRWKGRMHGSYFGYGFAREANYMSIPGGVVLILLGIAISPILPPQLQMILIYVALFVMVIGFLIAWRLFKPEWVRWVEEYHKDIIPYLQIEIRDKGWHVTTQEELEDWLKELRAKYSHHLK